MVRSAGLLIGDREWKAGYRGAAIRQLIEREACSGSNDLNSIDWRGVLAKWTFPVLEFVVTLLGFKIFSAAISLVSKILFAMHHSQMRKGNRGRRKEAGRRGIARECKTNHRLLDMGVHIVHVGL